jgi:hypothetical protein
MVFQSAIVLTVGMATGLPRTRSFVDILVTY